MHIRERSKPQGKTNKSKQYNKAHNATYEFKVLATIKAKKCSKPITKPAPGHQKHTTKCTNKMHRNDRNIKNYT